MNSLYSRCSLKGHMEYPDYVYRYLSFAIVDISISILLLTICMNRLFKFTQKCGKNQIRLPAKIYVNCPK